MFIVFRLVGQGEALRLGSICAVRRVREVEGRCAVTESRASGVYLWDREGGRGGWMRWAAAW